MKKLAQAGFAAMELLLVIVVVAILGLIGYKVYSHSGFRASQSDASSTGSTQKETSGLSTVPEVNNKSDLDKASSALDQNDTTGANSSDDNLLKVQSADN
jgi:prepilin-type N-terminal cleavage/methylation domain-containing protein